MHERDLFIDRHWRTAQSRRRLTINDPATGEPVGSTAMADAADIDARACKIVGCLTPRAAQNDCHCPSGKLGNAA